MNTNSIAFIALCNEFCTALENAREAEEPSDFIDQMLRLLPRIYISATDIQAPALLDEEDYLMDALDEDYYDAIRRSLEEVIGENDVYLDVEEEDMKYSDTPVSASISEGLADLFQVLYNFIATVRDATDDVRENALAAVTDDFRTTWSGTLCNVLRALNNIKMQSI